MNKITTISGLSYLTSNRYNYLLYRRLANKNDTSSSSDSSSDSDNEIKKRKTILHSSSKPTPDNNEALLKLNLLIQQMLTEDKSEQTPKLDLAKPKGRSKRLTPEEKAKRMEKNGPTVKNVIQSAKDVAESLGGDVKQTESELLAKLFNLPEKKDSTTSLSELIQGMNIVKEKDTQEQYSRSDQVKAMLNVVQSSIGQTKKHTKSVLRRLKTIDESKDFEKLNMFDSQPLGFFKPDDTYIESTSNKTWNKLIGRELRLAVTHPPSNYFQQMILWTEQGKIWKFPIDNEQGMEDEHNIYFTEHVFLERYLEPWCPPKGPIRHYMELVCVGLSKNPYMSVEHKKEHIEWYKNYFSEKQKLLKEIGAIPQQFSMEQIEKKE